MIYKRAALIVAILGLLGGVLAYARGRDMDLKAVEIRQEQQGEILVDVSRKLDAIYLHLINNRASCPNSDKREEK